MEVCSSQVWPPTYDARGTPKSKLLVGWTLPPAVMIGRYSTSDAARAKTFWVDEI